MKASFESLINSETPVLVDFHAEWCGPCKVQSPILKEVASEMKEKVRVLKIDVDKNQAVSMKYQIQSVPTLILFKNGKIIHRQSGTASKLQLIQLINQNQ